MQSRKLPNFYRNLIPNFQSCVRKSFLGVLKVIPWYLKILPKPCVVPSIVRSLLKFIDTRDFRKLSLYLGGGGGREME